MGDDDKAVDKILRDWYVGAVDIVPAPRSLVDGVIAAETEPQKLYSDMATLLGWYLEKGCPPELFASAFCAALHFRMGSKASKRLIREMGKPDFHKMMERWAIAQIFRATPGTNKSEFARNLAAVNGKMIKDRGAFRVGTGTQDEKAMRKYVDRALKEFKP